MSTSNLTTIRFHGADLIAQRGSNPETTLIAMKPVVEGMGLDWAGQFTKIKSHPILSPGIGEIPIPSAGGVQMMIALPLNRLHFWLATVNPNKIPDPITRGKVMIYQNEVADTLFDKFFGRAIATPFSKAELGRQSAAILDDKLESLVARLLPAMVEREILKGGLYTGREYVPAIDVVKEHKVPPKGRRAFAQRCSAQMRRLSVELGRAPRLSPETGRYLFHVDVVGVWLERGGKALILAHIAAVKGQGVLPFAPRPAA